MNNNRFYKNNLFTFKDVKGFLDKEQMIKSSVQFTHASSVLNGFNDFV